MILENVLIVDPEDGEYTGKLTIEDGKIVDTEPISGKAEAVVMPGFIDSHTHGAIGVDFMEENQDLKDICEFFYSQGVTRFFPTSVSADLESMLSFLKRVLKWMEEYPCVGGAHLEGPYISPQKKGAQNEKYIRSPSDREIDEILGVGSLSIITLAPEVVEKSQIEKLVDSGKIVSLGHSNATYSEAVSGIEAGATRITHFPNALRPLHHREVGIFGAGLLENVYLELIADLIHVSDKMIKIMTSLKDYDSIILITDSISATGLEDGDYELGGLKVSVDGGVARLEDGTLAGSTLTFSKAVKNFKKVTGCSLSDLAKVSSRNAALNLGMENVGRISKGFEADLVVLDFDLNVLEVYKSGERVWIRREDP